MENENCGNCKYSKPSKKILACRRYPPKIISDVMGDDDINSLTEEREMQIWTNHKTCFPEINKDDWCGEWRKK